MELNLTELIIKLSDEQENKKIFQSLIRDILRYLTIKKIKDIKLFQQRTGTEYTNFYESLHYSKEMKDDLLSNDEFFELIIKESKRFKF